jgi:hypothetical protein
MIPLGRAASMESRSGTSVKREQNPKLDVRTGIAALTRIVRLKLTKAAHVALQAAISERGSTTVSSWFAITCSLRST